MLYVNLPRKHGVPTRTPRHVGSVTEGAINFLQSLSAIRTRTCKQGQVTFPGNNQFSHKVTAPAVGWGFVKETNAKQTLKFSLLSHTHAYK